MPSGNSHTGTSYMYNVVYSSHFVSFQDVKCDAVEKLS